MREIKFRAWVNSYSHWHMTDEINISNSGAFFHVGQSNITNPDWKLMQYTGLKDKNGKEIYEGDILQVGKEYSGTFNPTYVTFEDGSFRHQISHMHNPVVLNSAKVMVLEVIGNIYENPKLLEATT